MSNVKLSNFVKTIQALASGYGSNTAAQTGVQGYRRSTAPTALPLGKILTTKLFPRGTRDSFIDWRTRHDLDRAQEQLLKLLPFYPEDATRKCQIIKTPVGNGNYINEFMIKPKGAKESDLNHLVLIHGYGAGLGFYLRNFDAISQSKDWCIHAIDLLGYGCSTRPKFDESISLEAYFIDSLETWRRARGIESMLMCAHSLGAHTALLYTLNSPGPVKKLLAISPAGVYRQELPDGSVPIWFDWLWERNISPFCLVRNAGPWGSMITSGWTSRRFAKLTELEKSRLHSYSYNLFNARGSGEYYMPQILGAGGVAKMPLVERVHEASCDIAWVYGDEDWMPKQGGVECTRIIKKDTPFDSEMVVMENCGHHLYLDNYNKFNEYLVDEMKRYQQKY